MNLGFKRGELLGHVEPAQQGLRSQDGEGWVLGTRLKGLPRCEEAFLLLLIASLGEREGILKCRPKVHEPLERFQVILMFGLKESRSPG
ncbi:unnamed protein product [Cuscuta campestris]|uniref:Uncharacterized protein n=1 Tax=Cuscuta campestris TaxID=132261 RepID=A0A484M4E4_9ASTE|nr:unnamed protein product [Cuscuta campestris]